MRKIRLNFEGLNSKAQIQEYIEERMEFPSYYGKNLDALYDCLTDICEPVAIACKMSDGQREDNGYLDKVCRTFQDAEMDNENLAVFFGREIEE